MGSTRRKRCSGTYQGLVVDGKAYESGDYRLFWKETVDKSIGVCYHISTGEIATYSVVKPGDKLAIVYAIASLFNLIWQPSKPTLEELTRNWS